MPTAQPAQRPDTALAMAPATGPATPVAKALETLARGVALVEAVHARPVSAEVAAARTGCRFYTRFLANTLREYDRFLSLIAEAVAAVEAPGHDARALARLRNTRLKLVRLAALRPQAAALPDGDFALVGACGRLIACLHHCGGRVHDAALWDDLAIAGGRRGGAGGFLTIDPATLGSIGRAHLAIARRLAAG